MSQSGFYPVLKKSEKKYLKIPLEGRFPIVSVEEALSKNFTIIDVRTKKEFEEGRIPNSLSVPLFDDLEHSEIGKIYKKYGKEKAVQKGREVFQPKIKQFLFSLSKLKSKHLVVCCARGGMRSSSIASLLTENGFFVSQMYGGYKGFRRFVLQQLEYTIPPIIVLHGKTGVGKTLILRKLPSYIDLEDLAQHRSSIFGAINKIPNTQKNFEALLVQKLSDFSNNFPIFVEGESRKVGKVFIPENLAKKMKEGVFVLLTSSIDTRVKRIVEEYRIPDDETFQKIYEILGSLIKSLGKSKVEKMRFWLKNGEIEDIVHMLLVYYYDPLYENSMGKYNFEKIFCTEDLSQAANDLIAFRKDYLKKL